MQNWSRSNPDGLVRFWPNGSGPEASQHARITRLSFGRTQLPTTSFPLSDLAGFLHRQPGSYCAKPAWIWLGSGWPCQVLAKRIQHGGKPVCKDYQASFWLMLPSQSGSDMNQIWPVYWVELWDSNSFFKVLRLFSLCLFCAWWFGHMSPTPGGKQRHRWDVKNKYLKFIDFIEGEGWDHFWRLLRMHAFINL